MRSPFRYDLSEKAVKGILRTYDMNVEHLGLVDILEFMQDSNDASERLLRDLLKELGQLN